METYQRSRPVKFVRNRTKKKKFWYFRVVIARRIGSLKWPKQSCHCGVVADHFSLFFQYERFLKCQFISLVYNKEYVTHDIFWLVPQRNRHLAQKQTLILILFTRLMREFLIATSQSKEEYRIWDLHRLINLIFHTLIIPILLF